MRSRSDRSGEQPNNGEAEKLTTVWIFLLLLLAIVVKTANSATNICESSEMSIRKATRILPPPRPHWYVFCFRERDVYVFFFKWT